MTARAERLRLGLDIVLVGAVLYLVYAVHEARTEAEQASHAASQAAAASRNAIAQSSTQYGELSSELASLTARKPGPGQLSGAISPESEWFWMSYVEALAEKSAHESGVDVEQVRTELRARARSRYGFDEPPGWEWLPVPMDPIEADGPSKEN